MARFLLIGLLVIEGILLCKVAGIAWEGASYDVRESYCGWVASRYVDPYLLGFFIDEVVPF